MFASEAATPPARGEPRAAAGPGRGRSLVALYLRLALGFGFLSAVADRLGLWGAPGQPNVAWGAFDPFLAYTAALNPYLPEAVIPALGTVVTALEVLLGITLLVGWRSRLAGLAAGVLLLLFGLGMTVGTGLKSALDASVFAASAGAFALAWLAPDRWSLDALRGDRRPSLLERGPVRTASLPGRWIWAALLAPLLPPSGVAAQMTPPGVPDTTIVRDHPAGDAGRHVEFLDFYLKDD